MSDLSQAEIDALVSTLLQDLLPRGPMVAWRVAVGVLGSLVSVSTLPYSHDRRAVVYKASDDVSEASYHYDGEVERLRDERERCEPAMVKRLPDRNEGPRKVVLDRVAEKLLSLALGSPELNEQRAAALAFAKRVDALLRG